jgi:hypothetical protein
MQLLQPLMRKLLLQQLTVPLPTPAEVGTLGQGSCCVDEVEAVTAVTDNLLQVGNISCVPDLPG